MPVVLRYSIWKVLAYFDLFNYPVSEQEIRSFLDQPVTAAELSASLQEMLGEQLVYHHEGYFSVRDERQLVLRRVAGYHRAQPLLRRGTRICHFLYQVPYVRALGISGSLSKNFADEDADIDYFIITKANRLWLARTMMHIFKKLSFLLGRQHWLCMNYYIDEQALEIQEQNSFTAMEVVTLYPVCGNGVLHDFFYRNGWTDQYFPNYRLKIDGNDFSRNDSLLKRLLERMLNGPVGDRLDNYFMRVTTRRWKKKEALRKKSAKGNLMGLQTDKHWSKPSPGLFQKKILERYAENLHRLSGGKKDGSLKASSSR